MSALSHFGLQEKSTFFSISELMKLSNSNLEISCGRLVMMLITPATASVPYKVELGPFIISICFISEVGIPFNP